MERAFGSGVGWSAWWKPALETASLDLRPHDLRHTCTALLIAEGAHPKAVQAQLGHSSIQVTIDRYGHRFHLRLRSLLVVWMLCIGERRYQRLQALLLHERNNCSIYDGYLTLCRH